MKKTRIVLVGALVLALAFVMGCGEKTKLDESVAEHKEGADKFTHEWEATYDSATYIRSAKQFGESGANKNDELTNIDAEITMLYPQNGKVGLIFGLTTNEGPKDANGKPTYTFNYYVFGVGEKPNTTTGDLNYYIDYCTNVSTLSGGNTASESIDKTDGASATSVATGDLTSTGHKHKEALKFNVNIEFTDDDANDVADGTYTLTVSAGGNELLTQSIDHSTYGYVNNAAKYPALGTVASYGMVSGAVKGEKKVDNTWVIKKDTLEGAGLNGSKLSAE
ncbi:MAG: hypothetical protein J6C11_07890 [Spirochaetaceae bacterium]|nr:hypothetical protein [Spirochaetaceae bacterium]